jgi:hypothetical protein
MTPLYWEPAVVFSSTVALMLFTPRATVLYFSSSSYRVASSATGRVAAGIFFFVLTRAASQPQEIAATVVTAIHPSARRINRFRPQAYKLSNLTTTRVPANAMKSL